MTDVEEPVTDAEVVDDAAEEELSSLEEELRTAQDAEPCGHPHSHGVCWFSAISEPCGFACKWLIDRGQDAGR